MSRRVCFVLPSLAGGGAERVAVTVLNHLDESKWRRSLFLFDRCGPYLAALSPAVPVSSANGRGRFGRILALRAHLAETRPHVVVAFLSYASVLAAVRLAGTGARVVFNQGTPVSSFLEDPDYKWMRPARRQMFTAVARLIYPRADLVMATSAGVARDLVERYGVSGQRVRVVHNPMDLDAIARGASAPVDENNSTGPVLVAAGRLAEVKNYPLMLEALAALRRRVDARLLVLGTGELEAVLRREAIQRGLERHVRFLGFQQNPWRYIARADAFVLTSRYEGFGNVLVEAMACGVPVVATGSPGTREVVNDGVNGLLVESHTADALAAALERVLVDAPLRARLIAGGKTRAASCALAPIIHEYEALFDEVAA